MDAKTKLQRARIALLLDEPFFGTLLLNLRPVQSDTVTKTMATDGQSLFWNKAQVEQWSESEIKTVLAHEALHCALLHQVRRGDRDGKQWNVACDHAVNLALEQCNVDARAKGRPAPFVWPVSTPPVMDSRFAGMGAEEIYGALGQREQDGQGQGQGQPGPGDGDGMGDVLDTPGAGDETEQGAQEAAWKQATVQAATAAKGRGSMPASMARLVEELIDPKPKWQELLRRFVSDRANDDYSWTRPNARYLGTGFVLPSLYNQRLGVLGIIRDTSGSVQDWQGAILSELAGIISETRPSRVVVIDADADVQRVLELDATDLLPTDALGGGGTDFRPALDRIAEFNPACVVYLTDLDGTFPAAEPAFPVLWATNNTYCKAPWGDTVAI